METLKKILSILSKLSTVAKWVVVLALAVAGCAVVLSLTSCAVSTKLTGTKTTIDTTHYIIHSYSKSYDKNR